MEKLLGPKALIHASKKLNFLKNDQPISCYLLGNAIHAFDPECNLDDYDIFDESEESIIPHITCIELPKDIHLVGLMSGSSKKIGIVNFGSLKQTD